MDKSFTMKFEDELWDRAREEAHKREISVAHLVREALEEYLKGGS